MRLDARQLRRDFARRYPQAAAVLAAAELDAAIRRIHHGGTESTEDRPSEGCLVPPARRVDAERADAPPCSPCLRGDDDWHGRRAALRRAGVEIKQFDGVLYVDGVISGDAALYPPGARVPF